MINDNVLSIEQMQHLESIGINISDASMIYIKCPVVGEIAALQVNIGQYEEGDCYTYTLTDILKKLSNIKIYYDNVHGLYEVKHDVDFNAAHIEQSKISLIDAAYNMLCWIKEHGIE